MSESRYRAILARIEAARDMPAREGSFKNFQFAFGRSDIEPIDPKSVILIAGTNGKGSVAKTLETLLLQENDAVGLFTSPHMMETTERIRSFGLDLSRQEFVDAFGRIEPKVSELGLSHFEILTMMMVEVFFGGRVRPKVDVAVIEVGVGGRLDSTRVIPHSWNVVTSLGLDHVDLLGGTLDSIAREKFGIVDQDGVVVHAPVPLEASAALADVKHKMPARWIEAKAFPSRVVKSKKPSWVIETPWGEAPLALLGARGVENTSIALRLLEARGHNVAKLLPALRQVRWPCRMEGFEVAGRMLYLSGDHNEEGVRSLIELLSHFEYRKLRLVVGVTGNKDPSKILDIFNELPGIEMILTKTPFRTGGSDQYAGWSQAHGVREIPEAHDALRTALGEAEEGDLVLVSGSLYLAGSLRKELLEGRFGETKAIT